MFWASCLLAGGYFASLSYVDHLNSRFPDLVRAAASDISESTEPVCLIAPPARREPLVAIGGRFDSLRWSDIVWSAIRYKARLPNERDYVSFFGKSYQEIHFGAVTRDGRLYHWSFRNRRFEPTRENYIRYDEARAVAQDCFAAMRD